MESENERNDNRLETNTGFKTVMGKLIRSGGFGKVYECEDDVVVKIASNLNVEIEFYETVPPSKFIPAYLGHGAYYDKQFIVLEKFDIDFKNLRRCDLKPHSLLFLARRAIEALRYCHAHGYAHGDVKAGNFLFKRFKAGIADFGFARKFVNPITESHVAYVETTKKCGTLSTMSVDAHRGVQPSRRSDMESLGWCLIEWFGGRLPWRKSDATNRYVRTCKLKLASNRNFKEFVQSCLGREAKYLAKYLKLTVHKNLVHSGLVGPEMTYEDEPEYDRLLELFS